MSLDEFHFAKYHPDNYNCLHFTCDVWRALTGNDIRERLDGLFVRASQRSVGKQIAAFERLPEPRDPCLVLMQRPRTSPHIGVYVRGKILHITSTGVEYLPTSLAMRGFKTVKFYR